MKIYGIGDSLTQGYGGGGTTYLNVLEGLLSSEVTTYNKGVGGEGAGTIFGRVNGIPFKVAEDITIPASNETAIEVKLTNDFGSCIFTLCLADGSPYNTAQCVIGGIVGTLHSDGGFYDMSVTYTFTRTTSGVAANIKAGEEILMLPNGVFGGMEPDSYQIIWVGQNGGYKWNESGRWQPNSGEHIDGMDVANYVNMIETHLKASPHAGFLVLSPSEKTTTLLENTLARKFGASFVNVRKELVSCGISVALENGYLTGDYPTPQDTEDINNGIVPTSLRYDNVHLNGVGYSVLAEILKTRINTVWNIN